MPWMPGTSIPVWKWRWTRFAARRGLNVHAGVLLPSHGRYVGASSKPMTEYRKQPGDRLGLNWMMPNVAGKRAIRHVIYDSNYWKSFIHARLAVPLGDKGNLSLYGRIPGILRASMVLPAPGGPTMSMP